MKLSHFFVFVVLAAIILLSGCAVMTRSGYEEDMARARIQGREEAFSECIRLLQNSILAIEQDKAAMSNEEMLSVIKADRDTNRFREAAERAAEKTNRDLNGDRK